MINVKNYNTEQEYQAETRSEQESVVSHIDAGNEVKCDGVNVETTTPMLGDAVYKDGNGAKHAFKAEGFNPSLLPADYTYEGVFIGYYKDGRWQVFMGNYSSLPSLPFAGLVQFRVTVPTETGMLTMGAQFVTAGTTTSISVEYEAGMTLATVANTYEENNTTLCGRINTALATLDGITGAWWAYLNSDGEVILQRDTWTDYRQYQCSGALTHVTWGDMPENSNAGFRINGRSGNEHIMNVAGGAAYYSTNGRTPSANVPLNEAAGIVKKADFETSAYCTLLRQTYGTYEEYIRKEYTLLYPQKLGVFRLPDGETLTKKYGPMTAPVKDGTSKAKFPALNWGYQQGGHLWDVSEGTVMMLDENLAKINAIQSKVGKVVLTNSAYRWFAERYNVNDAWIFGGNARTLVSSIVNSAYQCGAVTLL